MARVTVESELTENELLWELTKELILEDRKPGDVSAYDLARATGLTRKRCSDILNDKVDKGLLVKVEVHADSTGKQRMFVYRKILKS